MKTKNLLFVLVLILLQSACTDKMEPDNNLILSPAELELINSCKTSLLTDQQAIEENLIGQWELVAYACSNCVPHSDPSASLTFSPGEGVLILTGELQDTTFNFEWSLEPADPESESLFQMQTTPEFYGLGFSYFCEDYIFLNYLAGDGVLLLYQKQ